MQQRGVEADCYSSLQISQFMGEKNSKVRKSLALNHLLWVGEKLYGNAEVLFYNRKLARARACLKRKQNVL